MGSTVPPAHSFLQPLLPLTSFCFVLFGPPSSSSSDVFAVLLSPIDFLDWPRWFMVFLFFFFFLTETVTNFYRFAIEKKRNRNGRMIWTKTTGPNRFLILRSTSSTWLTLQILLFFFFLFSPSKKEKRNIQLFQFWRKLATIADKSKSSCILLWMQFHYDYYFCFFFKFSPRFFN